MSKETDQYAETEKSGEVDPLKPGSIFDFKLFGGSTHAGSAGTEKTRKTFAEMLKDALNFVRGRG